MPSRYFKGDTVTGPVREADAACFRDLVDNFRVCPQLGIARDAFLALPKAKRNEIKMVPFVVPGVFRHSPSERQQNKVTHCNLICLDIDELPNGQCPAAPFVNNPDALYTALGGFNFVAHTTASSTPEKPRMRIIIDADNIPVASYKKAVLTIGKLLGLVSITKESFLCHQPMFLPTLFSDTTEDGHPLIAHRVDGDTFTTDDIDTDGYTGQNENNFTPSADPGLDALAFLRAPVPEITLAVAKEALCRIDPDVGYSDWLELAAALKHQFSARQGDDAYELFDEWSSEGSKYAGSEDTKAKWESLRPTPIGRVPITIRSLLRQAVEAGWEDKKVKEDCFNSLIRWMEEVTEVTDLMDKGPAKILATPMLTPMQESVLVNMICKQAKTRFIYTIEPRAVRKEIDRLKAEMRAQEKSTEKLKTPRFLNNVLYVSVTGELYRQHTGERYKRATFDDTYSRNLLPTEEQLRELGKPVTNATLSKPLVLPSDYALNSIKIPTVYDYTYDPSQPANVHFVHRGRKFVNTYAPTYPELDHDKADDAGALLITHLKNLIAEKEYRRVVLDYMAFMVQFPGRKIRYAILIQGAQGCGKTALANVMQAILGEEHVKIVSDTVIKTGYNEWAFGHQFVALEEIRVVGTSRHEIMNALKPLITNDRIPINQKFRDTREVANVSNYMAFTNYADALAITDDDRRWFVLKCILQTRGAVEALRNGGYFKTFFSFLKDHPGAFRAFLMDWKISPDFDADGHAPRTKYVQELINDTASDIVAAVRRLLHEGDNPLVQYDVVSSKRIVDILQATEQLGGISGQKIARVLREEGFVQAGYIDLDSDKHYIWARNDVDNARDIARDRVKRNLKNLCMHLLYEE